MEKFAFLDRLTKKLGARGCSVGWNPDSQDWDLKVRRGALGEAKVQMVVEHHGGAKRLGRLAAQIKPSRSVYWVQAILALTAVTLARLGLYVPLGVVVLLAAAMWLAPINEADRLEGAIESAMEEIVAELGPAMDTRRSG